MKITLNNFVTTSLDNKLIRKYTSGKSETEIALNELMTFKYKQFRHFLNNLDLREVAILILFQYELLIKRIYLHLSKECKEELNLFLENENILTEDEKISFVTLLKLNILLG